MCRKQKHHILHIIPSGKDRWRSPLPRFRGKQWPGVMLNQLAWEWRSPSILSRGYTLEHISKWWDPNVWMISILDSLAKYDITKFVLSCWTVVVRFASHIIHLCIRCWMLICSRESGYPSMSPPRKEGLIGGLLRDNDMTMMVNAPLIRPYFRGGGIRGYP